MPLQFFQVRVTPIVVALVLALLCVIGINNAIKLNEVIANQQEVLKLLRER